jgi:hypothetical protein
MILKADRERLYSLVDELLNGIEEEHPDATLALDEATIILILAEQEDEGVQEHTVMISTSARRFVQEGILYAALREHEETLAAGEQDDDE